MRRFVSSSGPRHGGSVSGSGKRFSGPLSLVPTDAHG